MRFPFGPIVCVLAAFAAGYGMSHWWASPGTFEAKGLHSPARMAQGAADAVAPDASATARLIQLSEQPASLARDHEIFAILQSMDGGDFLRAVADFPALIRSFEQMPAHLRNMIAQAAVERWMEVDPEGLKGWLGGAQALMKLLPDGRQRELDRGVMAVIFPILTRNDPAWCRAGMRDLQPDEVKQIAIHNLMRQTAITDPKLALEWLQDYPEGEAHLVAVEGIVGGLVESDSQAAAELIRGFSNPDMQLRATRAAVMATGRQSAASMKDLLAQLDIDQDRGGWIGFATEALAAQSTSDPFAFLEDQLASVSDSDQKSAAVTGSLRTLFTSDSERAVALVENLQGSERLRAVETMLSLWPDRDPTAALHWLATQPPEQLPTNSRTWDGDLSRLAAAAPAEFGQWVDSLPSGNLQDSSRVLLATRLAESGDMTQAITLFRQSATRPMSETTATTFGRTLASKDPKKAAETIALLPPGAAQSSAALGVAFSWSERDLQAAASWIANLPPGGARDSATSGLAGTLSYADPVIASQWTEAIRDPQIRSKTAQQIFHLWTPEDPAQAAKWFSGLDYVEAEQKNALLRAQR